MAIKIRVLIAEVITYQLEAADVLHKAFYETEEQKLHLMREWA